MPSYQIIVRDHVVLLDEGDRDLVLPYTWSIKRDKRAAYARTHTRHADGTWHTMYMHRLILDAPADCHVDHINGDGLDNRRENLRLCSPAENAHNSIVPLGESGFRGVHFHKAAKKWTASIKVRGELKHLGWFPDSLTAARAYDAAAREAFGAFARLNLPISGERSTRGLVHD